MLNEVKRSDLHTHPHPHRLGGWKMASMDEQQLPQSLVDPIAYGTFSGPMVASDGHTYDRSSILAWFEQCRQQEQPLTSPMTGEAMEDALQGNIIVQQLIAEVNCVSQPVSEPTNTNTPLKSEKRRVGKKS